MIIPKPQFTKEECKNNNHWLVPYNKGSMICMKCGRFAKIGRLYYPNSDKKGGADMRKPNCVTCDHFGDCEGCEKGEEE